MKTLQSKLIEFHRVFDHPIRPAPMTDLPEKEVRLRAKLIAEEALETLKALFSYPDDQNFKEVEDLLESIIDTMPIKVDLPELADGLADLAYVVEGTNLSFGIDGEGVLAIVHRANMAKAMPCTRCGGSCKMSVLVDDSCPELGSTEATCVRCEGIGRISIKDGNGKTVKPEGWKPPDIADELSVQKEMPEEFGLAGVLEEEGFR